MDRGWRDHGWAESVYYPGNNQKIGETRMHLDRIFFVSQSYTVHAFIYPCRGVKVTKCHFARGLEMGRP